MRDRSESKNIRGIADVLDTFSREERSEIMRRVRSTDTRPELEVRSLLHRLGFRFRLHRGDLPGKPDIVLPKYRTVIFVHGCFWHRHVGCRRASTPATRQSYWLPKFNRTVERDRSNQEQLTELGWSVIIVWECEIRELEDLAGRLKRAIFAGPVLYKPRPLRVPLAADDGGVYRIHDNATGKQPK